VERREALLIRVFAAWTVWVWGTRIWNVLGEDDRSVGFKLVHVALALVSVALAAVTWGIVRRVRARQ
jgi:hypothetical protein